MKILHTSDWHLGRLLHEKSLIEDQRHALGQILLIMKEDRHEALVVAGDVFDRSIPSVEGVGLFGWFLSEMRSFSSMPVIIIPGNHDSAARLSYCSDLLRISNVFIQGDPQRSGQPLVLGGEVGARVFMLPYLEPHAFTGEAGEEAKFTHEAAVRTAIDRMGAGNGERTIDILVAHLFTTGGAASDSERKFIGASGLVDPALFTRFDYAALGHLHRPQKISESAWYSGSLLKYSFSEAGDAKCVLSVDIKPGSAGVERIAIKPLRDMARIRGKLADLLAGREFDAAQDCYCEAELTDPGLVTNPLALLRRRFPFILSVRQSSPESVFSERMVEAFTAERSLEDDFISFKRYLYSENPSADEMNMFRQICAEKTVE